MIGYSYDKIHIIIQQAYIINQYFMKNNLCFYFLLKYLYLVHS